MKMNYAKREPITIKEESTEAERYAKETARQMAIMREGGKPFFPCYIEGWEEEKTPEAEAANVAKIVDVLKSMDCSWQSPEDGIFHSVNLFLEGGLFGSPSQESLAKVMAQLVHTRIVCTGKDRWAVWNGILSCWQEKDTDAITVDFNSYFDGVEAYITGRIYGEGGLAGLLKEAEAKTATPKKLLTATEKEKREAQAAAEKATAYEAKLKQYKYTLSLFGTQQGKYRIILATGARLRALGVRMNACKQAVCFTNGWFDSQELKFHACPKRELYSTRVIPFPYIDGYKSEVWEKAIHETFTETDAQGHAPKGVSPEVVEQHAKENCLYFQKYLGYALTARQQKPLKFILAWYGPTGNNGKSTIQNAILGTFGMDPRKNSPDSPLHHETYACSVGAPVICTSKEEQESGEKPSPELAKVREKLFIAVAEPRTGFYVSGNMLKKFVGDDSITARELYHSGTDFQIEGNALVSTNFPLVCPEDTGVGRQMKIRHVPAPHVFTEENGDPYMKRRMDTPEVHTAIAAWLVEGCVLACEDIAKTGDLVMPPQVLAMTQEKAEAVDSVSQLLNALCVSEPEGAPAKVHVSRSMLYKLYKEYCRVEFGKTEKFIMSCKKFTDDLAQKSFRVSPKKGYTADSPAYQQVYIEGIGVGYDRLVRFCRQFGIRLSEAPLEVDCEWAKACGTAYFSEEKEAEAQEEQPSVESLEDQIARLQAQLAEAKKAEAGQQQKQQEETVEPQEYTSAGLQKIKDPAAVLRAMQEYAKTGKAATERKAPKPEAVKLKNPEDIIWI